MTMSPAPVCARTSTVELLGSGAVAVVSPLRTDPNFEATSSHADAPSRMPISIAPAPVRAETDPVETSAIRMSPAAEPAVREL